MKRVDALVRATVVAFAALSLVPAAEAAPGSDWATFLGPTGDAKSSETGILKDWGESGPELLWHVTVGDGYAAPTIADGRLFFFDRRGSAARLTCLDARSGKQRWRTEYATDYEDMYGYSNGPRAVPIVDGDRVYTFGAGGRLRCHHVKDGSLIWDVDTSKAFNVAKNFFGAGSVPVIHGDLLIAGIGGSGGIVAFDKMTGEVRYRITDELASYSSPVIAKIGERGWGFYFARGGLVGFEPRGGTVDFHFPFRAKKPESVNASNPVVVGDTVFITESYGPGSAVLRVRPGGYEVVRREQSRRGQSMSCHFMTPIHHDGILYGSSGQGSGEAELRAIDYMTGEIRWSEPGLGRATLLHVDGHLVVYTERGRLLLVEATPERYKVVADATPLLPETVKAPRRQLLGYPAWSSPVLSHGILYLAGKGRLAAFRLIPPASGQ